MRKIKELSKHGDSPCSWIGRLNVVKMSVLSNLISIWIQRNPNRNAKKLFCGYGQPDSKVYMERQRSGIVRSVLKGTQRKPHIYHRLWVMTTCRRRFIHGNKCTMWVWNVDRGEGCAGAGGRGRRWGRAQCLSPLCHSGSIAVGKQDKYADVLIFVARG